MSEFCRHRCAHAAPASTRHAKLMPMKDGIVELRQRARRSGSSARMLATVDVFVGSDTIARFFAQ